MRGTARQASIELDEQLGARQHVPGSMIRMGHIYTRQGEHQRGLDILDDAIVLATEFGEQIYVAEALNCRGDARLRHGDCDLARQDRLAARLIGEEICSEWVVIDATNGLGEIARSERDLTTAVEHFSSALAAALKIGCAEETQRAREGLAACIGAGASA